MRGSVRSTLIVGVVAAGAAVMAVSLLGRRRAPRPGADAAPRPAQSPEWLRRFVSTRFNPVVERLGLVGGSTSSWAYVEHVGRRSGIVYRTPVLPRIVGDFAYVPLPYGVDVNWSRNVRAAGHCRIQLRGATYELDEPAVVTAAEHPGVPPALRGWLVRRGNRYLRLHVMATLPGTLDETAVPESSLHPEITAVAGEPLAAPS